MRILGHCLHAPGKFKRIRCAQAFTTLTSLKKLRLDSCGKLQCHPDVAGGMLKQLEDVSLRQCRLGNLGCLDVLMGLPTLRVLPASVSWWLSRCPAVCGVHYTVGNTQ